MAQFPIPNNYMMPFSAQMQQQFQTFGAMQPQQFAQGFSTFAMPNQNGLNNVQQQQQLPQQFATQVEPVAVEAPLAAAPVVPPQDLSQLKQDVIHEEIIHVQPALAPALAAAAPANHGMQTMQFFGLFPFGPSPVPTTTPIGATSDDGLNNFGSTLSNLLNNLARGLDEASTNSNGATATNGGAATTTAPAASIVEVPIGTNSNVSPVRNPPANPAPTVPAASGANPGAATTATTAPTTTLPGNITPITTTPGIAQSGTVVTPTGERIRIRDGAVIIEPPDPSTTPIAPNVNPLSSDGTGSALGDAINNLLASFSRALDSSGVTTDTANNGGNVAGQPTRTVTTAAAAAVDQEDKPRQYRHKNDKYKDKYHNNNNNNNEKLVIAQEPEEFAVILHDAERDPVTGALHRTFSVASLDRLHDVPAEDNTPRPQVLQTRNAERVEMLTLNKPQEEQDNKHATWWFSADDDDADADGQYKDKYDKQRQGADAAYDQRRDPRHSRDYRNDNKAANENNKKNDHHDDDDDDYDLNDYYDHRDKTRQKKRPAYEERIRDKQQQLDNKNNDWFDEIQISEEQLHDWVEKNKDHKYEKPMAAAPSASSSRRFRTTQLTTPPAPPAAPTNPANRDNNGGLGLRFLNAIGSAFGVEQSESQRISPTEQSRKERQARRDERKRQDAASAHDMAALRDALEAGAN